MTEKKYFDGLLNADDAEEFVKPNEFTNSVNLRFGTSDDGKTGWFENIHSNVAVTHTLPSGTNTCMGSVVDEDEESILWFNHNSLGEDGIYIFFNKTSVIKTVLLSSQVTGGLSFTSQIQCKVLGDQLYWLDGDFKRINYKAAIKMNDGAYVYKYAYSNPLAASVITVIRRPPQLPLNPIKNTEGLVANFIKDEAFKFSYFYTYKDGEESVLAPWSNLVDYNGASDNYDGVWLYVPLAEKIEQDVHKVSIVVRFETSQKCFTVREYNLDNSDDALEISNHNSGTTQLIFKFYNNQNGIALSDAYSVKPFDSVPLDPKTLEAARNRLTVANYTKGYTAPVKTSLGLSLPTVTTPSGNWFKLQYRVGLATYTKYLIDILGIGSVYDGYYEDPSVTSGPFPVSVNYPSLTYTGAGFIAMIAHYGISVTDVISFTYQGASSTVLSAPTSSSVGTAVIKSDAPYQAGVVFFDAGRRKCGVVTNKNLRISTADRDYTDIKNVPQINWTLDNTSALSEIPDWATHYAVVSTKCLRTSFFLQLRTDKIIYVDKDTSGAYVFGTTSTYATNRAGVAISIKNLDSYKMGYTFAEGDICKVWMGSSVYSLAVIAQDGDWIVCQNKDLGVLNVNTAKFEIYTPKKDSLQEFYYEQGEIFAINNPGGLSRTYSVTAGNIPGDVWVLQRDFLGTPYNVEAMSPNDKYYQNWFTDAGMGTIIDTIGQQVKKNFISYSNKFIPGTNSNGLCTYDALDEAEVPLECGAINKLQLTSKTKEDGTVLLAICQYETASIYLGEAQLVSQQGNSFVARSDGFIGTINILKGSFGTQHPESVALFRGMVMWFDVFNGVVVQYSSNGLFPISSNKVETFFSRLGKDYISSGATANFFGGFDPYHQEYLISTSFVGNGVNVNFPTTTVQNRLNLYDGNPKTLAYKIGADKWVGNYNFIPENIVYLGMKMFTFKNGRLYTQDSTYNNFYGVQYDTIISFPSNQELNRTKVYENLFVEANRAPDNVYIYTSRPDEQITTLVADDFENKEGVFYSAIYRDRLSPIDGSVDKKMMAGDKMRSTAMNFQAHFSGSNKLELKFININYNLSLGHKT